VRVYYSERTTESEIAYFRNQTLLRGKFDALASNKMFGLSK